MTWHPWRHIRHLPDVKVEWERHDGDLGTWCGADKTMTFHPDQSQAQRRCTATHEIVHAELNHDGPCDEATELVVRKVSARRLITIKELGDAVVFHGEDHQALAEELWVDLDTLRTRLDHLHPAEMGHLKMRISMKENTA